MSGNHKPPEDFDKARAGAKLDRLPDAIDNGGENRAADAGAKPGIIAPGGAHARGPARGFILAIIAGLVFWLAIIYVFARML